MAEPRQSRHDPSLSQTLRLARLTRGLSQEQLARSLGVRQRQISDLERAAMDPRLSTIQNVARALDLELTLIPRQLISAVDGLQRAGAAGASIRPMYLLASGDDVIESADQARVDVGGDTGARRASQARRRRAKGPR